MRRSGNESKIFTTPMGVVKWGKVQLKSSEMLSHRTAPPVFKNIWLVLYNWARMEII